MCYPVHNWSQNNNISQAEINLSTMFHYSPSTYMKHKTLIVAAVTNILWKPFFKIRMFINHLMF